DIRENKGEILALATGAEVGRALPTDPCISRCFAPPLHEFNGFAVHGSVAPFYKVLCNPGAAQLVFFAKFAPTARTNYRHMGKIRRVKGVGERKVIGQTSQEYRIRAL